MLLIIYVHKKIVLFVFFNASAKRKKSQITGL